MKHKRDAKKSYEKTQLKHGVKIYAKQSENTQEISGSSFLLFLRPKTKLALEQG